MKWKIIEQERRIGFGPTDTRTEIIHHLEIPEEDWSQLEAAMTEFWVRFCEAISKEYAGKSMNLRRSTSLSDPMTECFMRSRDCNLGIRV